MSFDLYNPSRHHKNSVFIVRIIFNGLTAYPDLTAPGCGNPKVTPLPLSGSLMDGPHL